MKLKTIILSAIAVIGMATPAFAKTNKVNSTDNNVSPDTEQIAEHDMNVYGANYTDGDKFDGLIILPENRTGSERKIKPIKTLSEHGQQLKKKVFSGVQGQSSLGSAKRTDDAAGA